MKDHGAIRLGIIAGIFGVVLTLGSVFHLGWQCAEQDAINKASQEIERARQEGYVRGWRDGSRHVLLVQEH